MVVSDLSADGFGHRWGHTRSYSNLVTASGGATVRNFNGANWFIKELPQVADDGSGAIAIIGVVQETLWFTLSGSDYVPKFFSRDKLTRSGTGTGDEFSLLTSKGESLKFHGFDSAIAAGLQGQFKSYTDPYGHVATLSPDGSNRPGSFDQSSSSSTTTYSSKLTYAYVSGTDLLASVTLSVNGTDVRRAVYDYFSDEDAGGSPGDLRTAAIQVPIGGGGWSASPTNYYRYYKSGEANGFDRGLKFAVSPATYQRLVADGYTPETVPDEVLIRYADNYYEYDSTTRKVTREIVYGLMPGHTFSYTPLTTSTDYNVPTTRTNEVLPNGDQVIAFTNFAGQPTLKIFQSGTNKWYEFFSYGTTGLGVQKGTSAAVSTADESTGAVTLNSAAGFIWLYDYYSGTGSAENYLSAINFKVGSGGSVTKLYEWAYTAQTVSGASIYPVLRASLYTSDSGGGSSRVDITYAYTWQANFQPLQITTTWPAITTAQNGAGGSTGNKRYDVFNEHGMPAWTKDERGAIGFTLYDLSTDGVLQSIVDVKTTLISGEPAGWTTVSGFGLHLITDYIIDGQGRSTQALGPEHDIDLAGTKTKIRTATWNVYFDVEHEQWNGSGYHRVVADDFYLINPVKIRRFDYGFRTIDLISAIRSNGAGALVAAGPFPQETWIRWQHRDYNIQGKLSEQRSYHEIPTGGAGAPFVNYGRAIYGYDGAQRWNRTQTADNTVVRTVYNSRGWVLEKWVGTSDAGATDTNPHPSGALGNDMVKTATYVYDSGSAGGNGLLTSTTKHVDDSSTDDRTTTYAYDSRDRCIKVDGEENYCATFAYDNPNRINTVKEWSGTDSPSSNLRAWREIKYDNLGRLYQCIRHGINQSTGADQTNKLKDDFWYDPAGNLLKLQQRGRRAWEKFTYDGAGRVTRHYYAYSTSEFSSPTYANASSIGNNVVMHQEEYAYDQANNLLQKTTRERFHDAAGNGALTSPSGSQPKARVSFLATYPDAIGRPFINANYGTYGGSSFSRADLAPLESSDTVLVNAVVYNNRGEANQIVDARSIVTWTIYDNRGRLVKLIQNYDPAVTASDANRTVEWTWSAGRLVTTMIARNASTGDQVTQYLYGTSLANSPVARFDLLHTIIYPDAYLPEATDRVTFSWNRQGELLRRTDQNGTIHDYSYDKLGRWTSDAVTVPSGSAIDTAVLRIAQTFAANGRIETITSYNAATGGSVVNQIKKEYGPWRQLTKEYQEHEGTVDTGASKKVQYAYDNGANNTVRRTLLAYPNNTGVNYPYGLTDDSDDVLSRVPTGPRSAAAVLRVTSIWVGSAECSGLLWKRVVAVVVAVAARNGGCSSLRVSQTGTRAINIRGWIALTGCEKHAGRAPRAAVRSNSSGCSMGSTREVIASGMKASWHLQPPSRMNFMNTMS